MKRILLIICILLVQAGNTNAGEPLRIEKKGDSFFMSVRKDLLGKDIFISSRVIGISGHRDIAAGQTFNPGTVIRFRVNNSLILMEEAYGNGTIRFDEEENVAGALTANSLPVYLYSFEVQKGDDQYYTFDVSKFFADEIPGLNPLPGGFKAGKPDSRISGIREYENLRDRVNVISDLTVTGHKTMFSVTIGYNFLVMDTPAEPREEEERIGFMTVPVKTAGDDQPISTVRYITKWDVQPREGFEEAHRKGEIVPVKEPIVFYADPAIPERYMDHIRLGILDWNDAFLRIGFKDVIQLRESGEMSALLRTDIRTNMIRFIPIARSNAMGVTLVDPRSGQIIQGDIYFFQNIEELLSSWRFVQTAAADPKARPGNMSPDVIGEMIRYVIAHEMGHVLGLKHNMRGSYAYPVDSLRSPSFTAEKGTTATIMDYARFNYVAQPGDLGRGVKLMPPKLGPYDYLAIKWGYAMENGSSPSRNFLDGLLEQASSDPELQFATTYMGQISPDPSAESDVLGDNVIRSSEAGIMNLRYIMANLAGWSREYGIPKSLMGARIDSIHKQFYKYLTNTAAYISGVYYLPSGKENIRQQYFPVPDPKRKEATIFIFDELVQSYDWLTNEELTRITGDSPNGLIKEQSTLVEALFEFVPRRLVVESSGSVASFYETAASVIFDSHREFNPLLEALQVSYINQLKKLAAKTGPDHTAPDNMVALISSVHLEGLTERISAMEKKSSGSHKSYYHLLNKLINEK